MAEIASTKIRGSEHSALIAYIKGAYPTARTTGFVAALKALPNAEYVPWLLSSAGGHGASYRIIPDAYYIDHTAKRVLVFEAVHRHDLTVRKFGTLVDLAWALDEDYYTLLLVRVDCHGVRTFNPQNALIAYNLDQAREGLPTSGNDVPCWSDYSEDVTNIKLAEYGSDPVAGLVQSILGSLSPHHDSGEGL